MISKKKIIATLSAALVGFSSASVPTYVSAEVKSIGDVDRSGVVDVEDVKIFRYCLLGLAFFESDDMLYADLNEDGLINIYDMILAKRTVLGIRPPVYPTETEPSYNPTESPTEVTEYPTEDVTDPTETPTESVTDPTESPTEAPDIQPITLSDMPQEYEYAADWIWTERIAKENSTKKRNIIFDQIVAGNGTLNYVVKWQSYKPLSLEQRRSFEIMLDNAVNGWTDWLVGYENWPYKHVDVKIVGWAVIDESCIVDRQPDEIVYTDTIPYDSQYDTVPDPVNNPVPDKEPLAPSELSRFDHYADTNYQYPGGLDKRFDMYLWGTQGFPSIGGCGGDWGQRLSDEAYINMLDGTGLHVLQHELGHGFGMTDFYGGEGEFNGFPPGGFPGGENSIMMAGSAIKITDFDGWELRYIWSKIKDEEGRFPNLN